MFRGPKKSSPNLGGPHLKPKEAGSEGARPRTMCFKQASWGARCRWPSAGGLFPAHGGWFSRPSSSSRWGEGHVCNGSSLSEAREPSSPPGRWEQGGVWAGGGRAGGDVRANGGGPYPVFLGALDTPGWRPERLSPFHPPSWATGFLFFSEL